jgi:UDP-N-acetylmuramate dehydrogenase
MGPFAGLEHIVRDNEPLAPYTWFRLGGAADFFAEPTTVDELSSLLKRAFDDGLSVRVLGGGSNVLIRDAGVRGLVVNLAAAAFSQISLKGPTLVAGGGAKLGHLVSTAVREGLSGLEQLVGIPGTVGGALHGNSGANGADIGQWTQAATVMNRSGEISQHPRHELQFSYRESSLDEPVILEAEFALEEDDPVELTKRMQKIWIVKKATLPQGDLNTGCIFKDVGGVSAASLVEQAGMKTARAGEAVVCPENSNFIVAQKGATSEDIVQLIEMVREGVAERLGVALETEIEVW